MSANAGLPARLTAMRLIEAAQARRGGLDVALNEPDFRSLSPEDRGFARALAMSVLRRMGSIDRALDTKLNRAPPMPVRQLLRIGLAQMLYLDTPDFAAVSTTVKLAERDNATRPYKALINAVLRGLGREPAPEPDADTDVPPWLFARWAQSFGRDQAEGIALNARHEPPTDLSLKPGEDAAALAGALEGEVLPGGSVRTRLGGDIMIHGRAVSVGCLAMGDEAAEELFALAAWVGMHKLRVLIAPTDFRLGEAALRIDPPWVAELYASLVQRLQVFPVP